MIPSIKRDTCEECGEYQLLNDDGICYGCAQDEQDLEDMFGDEETEDEKVEV